MMGWERGYEVAVNAGCAPSLPPDARSTSFALADYRLLGGCHEELRPSAAGGLSVSIESTREFFQSLHRRNSVAILDART